ncbi:MAG: tyrosine-type recombinase/integrase [Candidatus Nitrosocosmicus sp.]
MSFQTTKSNLHQDKGDLSPYQKFIYALRAPESKRQYPRRFQVFLDFINLPDLNVEEKVDLLYGYIEHKGRNWLEGELIRFFTFQNQRAERNEISTETIKNYLKPVKLFCEMNGIMINWKLISKGIMRGDRYSNDRPPSREEIKKLLQYPDRRIKPIVLIMVSCGMRVGSWAYLKWGDIKPMSKDGKIVAGRIKIFNTKTKKFYISFISLEAWNSVKNWMEFRQSFGEKINEESWVMRNLWQIKSQRYGNYLGLAKHPVQFSVDGIRMLINDAWKIQGVREEFENGKKYPFKSLHGFRKYFDTECQKTMKTINVSILMSHDIGITQHYYKPQEDELLEDYLKAIPSLTIESDEIQLSKQIEELEEKNKNSDWIIKGQLREKDQEIKNMRGELDIVKQQMKSMLGLIQVINSDDERESLVKSMISHGIYESSS